ncbi:MAG: hypothetical protein J2P46_17260 [Zavarzinella sp.]|nr:hypothetical protein [Zavarzinella sp.]
MNTFETSATIGDHGQLHLDGVPFATGTAVKVSIRPQARTEAESPDIDTEGVTAARARMRELFRTVRGFRMAPKIAREDLYDRRSLR